MAQWLEVHPNTVRNWIGGRTKPRPSDLKQWALRVQVPYEWLVFGDEPVKRWAAGDSNPKPEGLSPTEPVSTLELRARFLKQLNGEKAHHHGRPRQELKP